MAEKIVTKQFKTHNVRQILESVTEPANTLYYAFTSRHIPYDGGDTPPILYDRSNDLTVNPYRDMIFGKKLDSGDMKLMVPKKIWTTNTVYTMYDHRDTDLFDSDFYVAVDEGSYYHVYKCLYNANGAASNDQPTFNEASTEAALYANNDQYYETGDGYQWRYMYSVDDVTFEKFATTNWMPVVANTTVEQNSTDGAIDVIKVDSNGSRYDNYISSNTYALTDNYSGDNTKMYLKSTANTSTGFYGNTIIYITSGTGAGQYKTITNSFNDGTATWIQLNSAWTTSLDATSTYSIYPQVLVTSDGTQSINCIARAVINSSSSNSVHQIEILERGSGYTFADATVLVGSASGSVVNASVVPIIGPRGGHGADAAKELGASSLGVVIQFANNESGNIPTDNDYRQFGIIQDPKFANVQIYTNKISNGSAGSDGTFSNGEIWYQFSKLRIYSNANVTTSNAILDSVEGDAEYNEYLSSGQFIYLTDSANNQHFISTVSSVTQNTITLADEVNFTSGNVEVYLANIIANGIVSNVSAGYILSSNTSGFVVADKIIIGANSYAVGNVDTIDQNSNYSNNATFSTFIQMEKYVGTLNGSFTEDEPVKLASNTSVTGYLHSFSNTENYVYLTRINGSFPVGGVVIGNTSGATLTITNKYTGEIEKNTGEVIFLQNDNAISRSNTQTETIRVILEF